ncbi:MAG: hypothetical protein ACI86M_002594 [Saprospiraceae bacterium]|jgi:hypothetical protein
MHGYSSGLYVNDYQINEKYTFSDDMLISEDKDLFGLYFPSPHPDFSIKLYKYQTSKYIIEDDKLIISITDVDNTAAKKEGDELEYEFKSTWIKS